MRHIIATITIYEDGERGDLGAIVVDQGGGSSHHSGAYRFPLGQEELPVREAYEKLLKSCLENVLFGREICVRLLKWRSHT